MECVYKSILSACPLLGGLSSFRVSFIRGFYCSYIRMCMPLSPQAIYWSLMGGLTEALRKMNMAIEIDSRKAEYYNLR